MVGGGPSGDPGAEAAFSTTDHGKTWHAATLPRDLKNLQALTCMPDGTCYLVYDSTTHQYSDMVVSHDRGRSWRRVRRAPGFTSESGFQCSTDRSCVYLADHVLEISSGSAPSWRSDPGPFDRDHVDNGAYTLACDGHPTCLIGGATDSDEQAVVWVRWRRWSDSSLQDHVRRLVPETNAAFVAAVSRFAASGPPPAGVDPQATLVADVEQNGDQIASLALHARGSAQRKLSAIADHWGAVHNDLLVLFVDLKFGYGPGKELRVYDKDVSRLVTAEHNAGYRAPSGFHVTLAGHPPATGGPGPGPAVLAVRPLG